MEDRRTVPTVDRLQTVDSLELDLVEVEAAIELVTRGVATRITLAGLRDPEGVAAAALVSAQSAGVRFALERSDGSSTAAIRIGPRMPEAC